MRQDAPRRATRRALVYQRALAGESSREIAAAIGVPLRTVQRDLAELRDELAAARAEQMQIVRARLVAEADRAIETLAAITRDDQVAAAVRVQAAQAVLAQLRLFDQQAEVASQLQELKERVRLLEERAAGGVVWTSILTASNGSSKGSKRQPQRRRSTSR